MVTGRVLFCGVAALFIQSSGQDYNGLNYTQHGDDWKIGECNTGSRQSPIFLNSTFTTVCRGPTLRIVQNEIAATLHYSASGITATSDNLGLELDLSDDVCVRGTDPVKLGILALDSFHFHSKAEHTIDLSDGNSSNDALRLDAELHLVFTDQERHPKAVVGFLLDQRAGRPSEFITSLMDAVRDESKEEATAQITWSTSGLITEADFHTYEGSLTTPNCSEPIIWFVGRIPMTLQQSKWFDVLHKNLPEGNYRRVQPLGSRVVSMLKMNFTEVSGQTSDVRKSTPIVVIAVATLITLI